MRSAHRARRNLLLDAAMPVLDETEASHLKMASTGSACFRWLCPNDSRRAIDAGQTEWVIRKSRFLCGRWLSVAV
jgi:hypothetical protein